MNAFILQKQTIFGTVSVYSALALVIKPIKNLYPYYLKVEIPSLTNPSNEHQFHNRDPIKITTIKVYKYNNFLT